jgi:DNA-directed RNA polymerase subunit F
MVIKQERPLTLSEVKSLVGDNERGDEIKKFLKPFIKLDEKKGLNLKNDLTKLNLIKLKESHIIKIIDFLPVSASELNKVLSDVSLDEEEINKILAVVKNY